MAPKNEALFFRCTKWKRRKHLLWFNTSKVRFLLLGRLESTELRCLNPTNLPKNADVKLEWFTLPTVHGKNEKTHLLNHQVITEIHSLKLTYILFKGNVESMIFLLQRWDMLVPWKVHHSYSNLVSPITTAFSFGVLIRTRPLLAAHRQCPSGSHSWRHVKKEWRDKLLLITNLHGI